MNDTRWFLDQGWQGCAPHSARRSGPPGPRQEARPQLPAWRHRDGIQGAGAKPPRQTAWLQAACWGGLLLLTVLAPPRVQAQQIGTYFSLARTYGYLQGPGRGKRYRVPKSTAHRLLGAKQDVKGRLWCHIQLQGEATTLRGEGWMIQGAQLKPAAAGYLQIYAQPPSLRGPAVQPVRILRQEFTLLRQVQPSADFAQVTWQKVRYESIQPLRVWVLDLKGMVRFGRQPQLVVEAYRAMIASQVPRDKRRRLLRGVVRQGDTEQEVHWALGQPLRRQQTSQNGVVRRVWEYPGHTVRLEGGAVKEIKARRDG